MINILLAMKFMPRFFRRKNKTWRLSHSHHKLICCIASLIVHRDSLIGIGVGVI